jgi:hypothetical protein
MGAHRFLLWLGVFCTLISICGHALADIDLGSYVDEDPPAVKVGRVISGKVASRMKMEVGDSILLVNDERITSYEGLKKALKADSVRIIYKRGEKYFLATASTQVREVWDPNGKFQIRELEVTPGAEGVFRDKRFIIIGKIQIANNYNDEVSINLYHPEAPDRVFASYKLPRLQTSFLNGFDQQSLRIGEDWLIDIVFRNGVRSQRNSVGTVGNYANGSWRLVATDIYDTMAPPKAPKRKKSETD